MNKLFLTGVLLLSGLFAMVHAQALQWERYHKSNIYAEGYYVSATPEGGCFTVGINSGLGGPSNKRMYVVKTDQQGYLEWDLTLGSAGSEGYSGLVTSDGNLLAVGEYRNPSGYGSQYLVKLDLAGNILWQNFYAPLSSNADQSYSVIETNDGHFIVGGDNKLLKTDTSGSEIWQKYAGDNRRDMILGADGSYIFTSYTTSAYGVIKTDTSGNVIWEYSQPSSQYKIYSLVETVDSGVLAGGLQTSQDDYYLMKLDKNGILEWDTTYENGNAQALSFFFYGKPFTINKTSDGNYILCGTIEFPGSSANHCWLQKIDAQGNVLWKNTHLLNGWNFYYHVEETPDKGFIITGEGYTSGNNLILLKTDSTGAFCSNEVFVSPNPVCIGDSATIISLATDPNFVWSINGIVDSTISSAAIETDTFSAVTSFEVFSSSCATRSSSELNVHRTYNTISTSGVGPFICQGGSVQLTSYDANSYTWSTGDTSQSISVSNTGTYSVTVSNECGIYDTTYQTVIAANPAAIPPPDTGICRGDTISLSASGGNEYLWTPGQYVLDVSNSTAQLFPPTSRVIYIIVTDTATSCSTWTSVNIDVSAEISPMVQVNGDLTGCKGNAASLSINFSSLPPYHDFEWSNGDSTLQTQTYESGPYFCDVFNLCGAFRSDTIFADYTELPLVGATDDTVSYCPDVPVQLSAIGNGSQYYWYDANRQPDTIWSEGFNYPDGTMQGPGSPPSWTTTCTSCFLSFGDYFSVFNGQYEGNDVDGVGTWISEWLDISAYSSVDVKVELEETGSMESQDYIWVRYQYFGQAEIDFETNGYLSDDFGSAIASQEGLMGDSVRIFVRMRNYSDAEFHRFDNVTVTGFTPLLVGSTINFPVINPTKVVVFADTIGCRSYDTIQLTAGAKCPPGIYSDNIMLTSAVLNWIPADSCNLRYEIRGRSINSPTWVTLNINPGSPDSLDVFNLAPNTSYVWQIRAFCALADPNDVSDWSDLDTFTTNACLPPDSIWTDTIASSGVSLYWSTAPGAFGYEIRGGLAGSPVVVKLVIPGQVNNYEVFNLSASSLYIWQVRSFCNANGSLASAFTSIDTFTTSSNKHGLIAESAGSAEPSVTLFPNPFASQARFSIRNFVFNGGEALLIFDANGRKVWQEQLFGRSFIEIDGKSFNPGLYLYQITGESPMTGKFIVTDQSKR